MIATSRIGPKLNVFASCTALGVVKNDVRAIASNATSRKPSGNSAAGTIASKNSKFLRPSTDR